MSWVDALLTAGYQLVLIGTAPADLAALLTEKAIAWLPRSPDEALLLTAIHSALRNAAQQQEITQIRRELAHKEAEAQSLYAIGKALSAERNLGRLEELIIQRCRALTGADACSLFVLDEDSEKRRVLRFDVIQNDTTGAAWPKILLPLDGKSIAGYVGLTGQALNLPDVYELDPDLPFSYNRSFDDRTGYRTKSMLTVPLRNHEGEIIGAVELINKKRTKTKLVTRETVERVVIPFTHRDEQVLAAFASQAAVALDNSLLLDSIEALFEAFVRASVTAIEERDPTTAGHSERVATLTLGIAQTIDHIAVGQWRGTHFTSQQLREIRYAGLLHDFGKIGVREDVLVKAKKLYDWQLELIRLRFGLAQRTLEAQQLRKQLVYAMEHGTEALESALAGFDAELEGAAHSLHDDLSTILQANEPTVLEEAAAERLAEIAAGFYPDVEGNSRPLLDEHELAALSIRRGSLTVAEYREIQTHVSQTFRFLSIMPWTRQLKNVPMIAGAHHEKLDGSGYPHGLKADEIPIQSRMMTIADIYDALTAADRPYKLAVPIPRALDILVDEGNHGQVDRDLLDVFIQHRVYENPLPIVTPDA